MCRTSEIDGRCVHLRVSDRCEISYAATLTRSMCRSTFQDPISVNFIKDRKNILKMNKEVGMLLEKKANTSGVGKMYNYVKISIYLLTTTPTNHTYTW